MKKIAIISALIVLACSTVPLTALALEGSETTTTETRTTTLRKAQDAKKALSTEKETESTTDIKRERLGADKLKICEKRQTRVNEIMTRVMSRSDSHFARITAAAERAEAFYVKQGNILSNYDALLAKVTSTKAAAHTAIDTLSSTPKFSCTSDSPKADLTDFKKNRSAKIAALSAYRDAVKDLIKGIKSVQPTDTTTSEVKQ